MGDGCTRRGTCSYGPIRQALIPEKMTDVAQQNVELSKLKLKVETTYTVALPASVFWGSCKGRMQPATEMLTSHYRRVTQVWPLEIAA